MGMEIKDVDVGQAHALQQNEGYTYVDVRSVPEFDAGHPAGAQNVPCCTGIRRRARCSRTPTSSP